MAYELGDVVAERLLEAAGPDREQRVVQVRIGMPFLDPLPGGDWCCPFQIVGLGDEAVRAAFGVDSMQALLLAVSAVRRHVEDRSATDTLHVGFLQQPNLGLQTD